MSASARERGATSKTLLVQGCARLISEGIPAVNEKATFAICIRSRESAVVCTVSHTRAFSSLAEKFLSQMHIRCYRALLRTSPYPHF
jgi:hypothetical protein